MEDFLKQINGIEKLLNERKIPQFYAEELIAFACINLTVKLGLEQKD
jgi:hypothetical protein